MTCPLSTGAVPENQCLFCGHSQVPHPARGGAKHWLACADRGGAGRCEVRWSAQGESHSLCLWLSGGDSVCEAGTWLLVDPGDLERALQSSQVWGVEGRRDLVHPTAEHRSRPGSDWKVKVRMCPKGSRNLSTWC